MKRSTIFSGLVVALLAAACSTTSLPTATPSGLATVPVTSSGGASTATLNPTVAAEARLDAQLRDLDPALRVKTGDLIPAVTMPIVSPDGTTKTLALRDFLRDQRTLLYFYVQDNTPL